MFRVDAMPVMVTAPASVIVNKGVVNVDPPFVVDAVKVNAAPTKSCTPKRHPLLFKPALIVIREEEFAFVESPMSRLVTVPTTFVEMFPVAVIVVVFTAASVVAPVTPRVPGMVTAFVVGAILNTIAAAP
jgi:hypothetical protein